jgi:hypothetical protein
MATCSMLMLCSPSLVRAPVSRACVVDPPWGRHTTPNSPAPNLALALALARLLRSPRLASETPEPYLMAPGLVADC